MFGYASHASPSCLECVPELEKTRIIYDDNSMKFWRYLKLFNFETVFFIDTRGCMSEFGLLNKVATFSILSNQFIKYSVT
jgi:hypothetical protein